MNRTREKEEKIVLENVKYLFSLSVEDRRNEFIKMLRKDS